MVSNPLWVGAPAVVVPGQGSSALNTTYHLPPTYPASSLQPKAKISLAAPESQEMKGPFAVLDSMGNHFEAA